MRFFLWPCCCAALQAGLVELQLPHGPPRRAAATLRELADAAERLDVDFGDFYGATPHPQAAGASPWLRDFEASVATALGKPAAVWCPSGTMAQQIVLCCAQRYRGQLDAGLPSTRRAVLLHPTSHLLLHENSAHARLLGVEAIEVGARAAPLSAAAFDVALDAACDALSWAPPACAIVELPMRELGGATVPLAELDAIAARCAASKVWLHCDGARLLEIAPWYSSAHAAADDDSDRSDDDDDDDAHLAALCARFDSVYVSFYKGLGGLAGAMLAGDEAFVAAARVWLRRFGGECHTAMPTALSALDAWSRRAEEPGFAARWEAARDRIEAMREADAEGEKARFTPDPPQCAMCHVHVRGAPAALEAARDAAARETDVGVFRRLRGESYAFGRGWQYFELAFGPANCAIDRADVARAWACFLSYVPDEPPP